jgi:erythromycin esterase-like protein
MSRAGLSAGSSLPDQIKQVARPWGKKEDVDALIDHIGDARYVLLGEASHGTSEYYAWRARISQRLIAGEISPGNGQWRDILLSSSRISVCTEKGFSFVAVEGDWTDCYRVNRFIKGSACHFRSQACNTVTHHQRCLQIP